MQLIKREHGKEQPYWPLGPFKIRLPFIHYRWGALYVTYLIRCSPSPWLDNARHSCGAALFEGL